jgi:hypothetical protein
MDIASNRAPPAWVQPRGLHGRGGTTVGIPRYESGGYGLGKLTQVPWVIGYDPKLLDTTSFLQRHTTGKPHTSYQGATLPLTN